MPRMNLYIPDDLAAQMAKSKIKPKSWSKLLQDAIRAYLAKGSK